MIELAEIEAARARIAGSVVRTPLVRLHVEDAPAEIYLKLENLQPINSFKIRGAANAVMLAPASARAKGLVTASAGNMAQGIAWTARELGVPATIVVPDHAPEAKIAAIERLGGRVLKVPYDAWWNVIVTSHLDGLDGLFVHPVQDPAVMAGNGTIGLEILQDLPDPDAVVIPYGGGGLTTGIASAVKALRPGTKIITAEPDTAAAMAAALAAGHPADVDYRASFVDGSGSRRVLDSMWPLVAPLVDVALAIPVAGVAAAVRTLAERVRVIAEGAGALAPAAALSGRAGTGKVVCVVSGGNINLSKLGFALPGAEARVAAIDDPGVTVPDGEAGELMIRGPLVMLGYYGNEAATRAAIEPDGWMHTGDIATRDDEGHYFIVDRRKDLIITGGFNVYPAEIERIVASHPAVAMVAVGSVPDETHGELARAYVVLRPGATATETQIIEHCRLHLAAYKLPRSVRFVPDLPKTSTGKVMRRELKTLDG